MPRLLARKRSPNLQLLVSVVVEPDDNNTFHAYAPALKGLHVDGSTEEEALQNATQAILVYLESLARSGDPLPVGQNLTVDEEVPEIPAGAFLRSITVQWPSLQTSGIS